MKQFNEFYQQIATNRLGHWLNTLPAQLSHWHENNLHGEFKHWQKTLDALPVVETNSTIDIVDTCLLYTSPSPRDLSTSRMPSSA